MSGPVSREHPRLYFSSEDLPGLRSLRGPGLHGKIWYNLRSSAEWCLSQKPRKNRIGVEYPDPIYENLYDRFYAIMHDVAIIEHLSLAYAIGEERKYGEAARRWLVSISRAWDAEGDHAPDASKAYAVSRLMKGLAVGYDVMHGELSEGERDDVLDTLSNIAGTYWDGYFSRPQARDWQDSAHHHIVEWSSFGVAALSMLGEVPRAGEWVDATVDKFDDQLLPMGLAPDGAQTEGSTFWASTMQYRIFFMDALRRITGKDLFAKHRDAMRGDLALAFIASENSAGYSVSNDSVVLNPSYGQLDYVSPVLLYLAREYRRPAHQYLALWDHALGGIQRTRYVTPSGEELLFELGGYAYLWFDPSITGSPKDLEEEPLSYHFPSVGEAYLRSSWKPGDVLIGFATDSLVVHAGGIAVMSAREDPPAGLNVLGLKEDGRTSTVTMGCEKGSMVITFRRGESVDVQRNLQGDWPFTSQGSPRLRGNGIEWPGIADLTVLEGCLSRWEPGGRPEELSVGHGKLKLRDPAPKSLASGAVRPTGEGRLHIRIHLGR
jgi:hypothetical protein